MIKSSFFFISHVFLLLFLMTFGTVTYAQSFQLKEEAPDMKDIVLPPADQIEPEYLQEMNEVYDECQSDPFDAGHRDCQCYAMRYLEERLESPEISSSSVMNYIEQDCFAPSSIAGYYYKLCLNVNRDRDIRDWENSCSCFGKEMADMAMRPNRLTYVILGDLQSRAYTRCGIY